MNNNEHQIKGTTIQSVSQPNNPRHDASRTPPVWSGRRPPPPPLQRSPARNFNADADAAVAAAVAVDSRCPAIGRLIRAEECGSADDDERPRRARALQRRPPFESSLLAIGGHSSSQRRCRGVAAAASGDDERRRRRRATAKAQAQTIVKPAGVDICVRSGVVESKRETIDQRDDSSSCRSNGRRTVDRCQEF